MQKLYGGKSHVDQGPSDKQAEVGPDASGEARPGEARLRRSLLPVTASRRRLGGLATSRRPAPMRASTG
jgi:hypothetical protein